MADGTNPRVTGDEVKTALASRLAPVGSERRLRPEILPSQRFRSDGIIRALASGSRSTSVVSRRRAISM